MERSRGTWKQVGQNYRHRWRLIRQESRRTVRTPMKEHVVAGLVAFLTAALTFASLRDVAWTVCAGAIALVAVHVVIAVIRAPVNADLRRRAKFKRVVAERDAAHEQVRRGREECEALRAEVRRVEAAAEAAIAQVVAKHEAEAEASKRRARTAHENPDTQLARFRAACDALLARAREAQFGDADAVRAYIVDVDALIGRSLTHGPQVAERRSFEMDLPMWALLDPRPSVDLSAADCALAGHTAVKWLASLRNRVDATMLRHDVAIETGL